jgi:type III secretion protein Q
MKRLRPHDHDGFMDALNHATALPATFPRLTANQAQALSLIALHGTDLAVTLPPVEGGEVASANWHVNFTSGAPDVLRQAASYRVELEWAGATLRLHLPPAALTSWINARVPSLGIGELPKPLRAAALETLLIEAVTALAKVSTGGPLRVTGEAGDVAMPHIWTLAAQAQATGDTVLAILETDGLGLMLLAGLLSKLPPTDSNQFEEGALTVPLRAVVGWASLSTVELHALDKSDVILLDEYLVGPQGELWLGIPQGQGLRVRADQSSYIVTQGWTPIMTETSTPAEETLAGEPLDVDAIPVRLTFDLGERALSLAELRQLQPGVIFDLQRPLGHGPVMIRANGALIGTGELVDVDGRVGVCIGTLGKGRA